MTRWRITFTDGSDEVVEGDRLTTGVSAECLYLQRKPSSSLPAQTVVTYPVVNVRKWEVVQ